jgi:hypothetical protein
MQVEQCRKRLRQIRLAGTPVDAKTRSFLEASEMIFEVFAHGARELLEISIPIIGEGNLAAGRFGECMNPFGLGERLHEHIRRW